MSVNHKIKTNKSDEPIGGSSVMNQIDISGGYAMGA
jgi:hypothetical protein